MHRAYSLFTVKSVDDAARTIEGIATTPSTDRVGDIVEPSGASVSLPIPFLWQHNRESPIGQVTQAKLTDDGILVRVQVASDDQPGPLKDLLDKAWRMIQKGLVRGLSIGFKPIEAADIKGTLGTRFTKWDWLELSAVTIPANAQATITLVKSLDDQAMPDVRPRLASVKLNTYKPEAPMNYGEQIKGLEASRAAKEAEREGIQEKASKDGRTKDAEEQESFDTLTGELKSIDRELVDLRALERENAAKAKPVTADTTEKASGSRGIVLTPVTEKLEPGIEFARFAMCVAAAKGNPTMALNLAQTHYGNHTGMIGVMKAAAEAGSSVAPFISDKAELRTRIKTDIPAGTTTQATWALPLLAYNTFAGDFLEFLRPQTIIGQFGQGGVPSLRRIPFNVHIKGQTTGGTGYWVGQGKPKPVTKFDFNDTYHGWYKAAAIAVLTEELIRFSDPSAERLVRDALAGCVVQVLDETFIDPAAAISVGVSPASITNGVSAITSSGDDFDAVLADINALWAAGIAANLPLTSAVYVTTPSIALALSLMTNSLGTAMQFPDITLRGGSIRGVPTIVSNYVPPGTFVLVFASEIWFSDDGVVTVDASTQASIQMMDDPTNDTSTPTHTSLVSLWQTNSVGLRAERFINWTKRRSTAVALLEAVSWGGAAES